MGTQSKITFIRKKRDIETPIVSILQIYDGYINGVGRELASWLLHKKMINGIGTGQYTPEFANGISDLAAQFIRFFKANEPGDLYVVESDYDPKLVDYNYKVVIDEDFQYPDEGKPLNDITIITVTNWEETKPIFVGTPQELNDYEESEGQLPHT